MRFLGSKLVSTNAVLTLGDNMGLEKDFVGQICWAKLSSHSQVVYPYIGLGRTLKSHEFTPTTSYNVHRLYVENVYCEICRKTQLSCCYFFQSHILPLLFYASGFPRNILPLQGELSTGIQVRSNICSYQIGFHLFSI